MDKDNNARFNNIYLKGVDGRETKNNPTKYLLDYLSAQGVILPEDCIKPLPQLREVERPTIQEQFNKSVVQNTTVNQNMAQRPIVNPNITQNMGQRPIVTQGTMVNPNNNQNGQVG